MSKKSPRLVTPFMYSVFILVALGIVYYYYPTLRSLLSPSSNNNAFTIKAPPAQPTPIPLTSGPGDYSVSHAKSTGPSISRVIFDPLDVKKNQTLKISVTLKSGLSIQSVTGTLTTDNQKLPLTFIFKNTNPDQTQIWETTLKLPDTVSFKYILSVIGLDANGKTTIVVAPRS